MANKKKGLLPEPNELVPSSRDKSTVSSKIRHVIPEKSKIIPEKSKKRNLIPG